MIPVKSLMSKDDSQSASQYRIILSSILSIIEEDSHLFSNSKTLPIISFWMSKKGDFIRRYEIGRNGENKPVLYYKEGRWKNQQTKDGRKIKTSVKNLVGMLQQYNIPIDELKADVLAYLHSIPANNYKSKLIKYLNG